MPGKKDVLSVKLDGLKRKKRKRLLLEDIDNLHQMFNEQYPKYKVSRTKFFELRPLWVIPVQKQSQEVCKCIYHANIDMICEALVNKARFRRLPIQFKDVYNDDNIWVKTVCSKYDETCVHRKCNKCGTGIIPSLFPFEHLGEIIQVSQWKSVTVERSTKDDKT